MATLQTITAPELREFLDNKSLRPNLKILDARRTFSSESEMVGSFRDVFFAEHIPTAFFYDHDEVSDLSHQLPQAFPSLVQFTAFVENHADHRCKQLVLTF